MNTNPLIAQQNFLMEKEKYYKRFGMVERAVSNLASPFGCCNFFDQCGNGDLMSLYFRGKMGLLDLLNFTPTNVCEKVQEYINYVRADSDGSSSPLVTDACATPNGVQWGACKLTLSDFGRIGRTSPERDVMKAEKYCETSPRYFLDNTPVTNEHAWDMLFTMEQLIYQDLNKRIIIGNSTNPGDFDGLQRIIRTGYATCDGALDSTVVDWNNNPMVGGAGATYSDGQVTSQAIAATFNLVDVLIDLNDRINQRISWSRLLGAQAIQPGQKVLVMSSQHKKCLLDFYTCWSVCASGDTVDSVDLSTFEARQFRQNLNGGMFGHGEIMLGDEVIPIMVHDWDMRYGDNRGDIYLLTLGVGSTRFWEGDFLDANEMIRQFNSVGNFSNPGDYFVTDGGRVLGKVDTTNRCRTFKLWMDLRLWCVAPWAQARIQNVVCARPLSMFSPDPTETSFFPFSITDVANCP